MTLSITLLLLIALMFSVYWWLSSIESSVGLVRLWPSLSDDPILANSRFTPIWEVTNVFLVFGFTGFSYLFSNAIVFVSRAVLSVVIIGVTALLVRVALALYIFYQNVPLGFNWLNILFAIVSFTVPICFASVGIFLLTGKNFWHTGVGWAGFGCLVSGLLALSVAFIFKQSKKYNKNLQYLSVFLNILFSILSSIIFIDLVGGSLNHMLNTSFIYFAVVIDLTIIIQAILLIIKQAKQMWWYLSFLAIVVPILLTLANRPYFAYPNISINTAYSASGFGKTFLVGLGFVVPIILIGLGLLYKLLPRSSDRVIK